MYASVCVIVFYMSIEGLWKQSQPVLRMQVDQECATGRCSGWDGAGLISGFRLRIKYSSWALTVLREYGLYCYSYTKSRLEQGSSGVYCQITCWPRVRLPPLDTQTPRCSCSHNVQHAFLSLCHTHIHTYMFKDTSPTHKHLLRLFQTVERCPSGISPVSSVFHVASMSPGAGSEGVLSDSSDTHR